jgi:hypothetical protein
LKKRRSQALVCYRVAKPKNSIAKWNFAMGKGRSQVDSSTSLRARLAAAAKERFAQNDALPAAVSPPETAWERGKRQE